MNPFDFQKDAVSLLVHHFKKLWHSPAKRAELVFQAPTGSGKTFMVTNFIREMNHQPDWDQDKAWVWITFSEDLAEQSRAKFREYFTPNEENPLLTIQDLKLGVLPKNAVLFLNWQKLVSRKAENRRNRRPEDELQRKETGFYFEDVLENTHAEGREIILVIDESHKNVTESARRDVIDPMRPRIVLEVSATPSRIPSQKECLDETAAYVRVKREEVVQAGLIKERIVCQTEEDLLRHAGENLDEVLLDLAMARQSDLRREFRKLGRNVNPLVLIQLPNDDQDLLKQDVPTKESVVTAFLRSRGVPESRIAYWFDKRKENMEFIEQPDSPVDFMLFKQAAGTGWDCPRAHVLVMYREIKSSTFYTQTLGRILRMPEPGQKKLYARSPMLRRGYLFTNYRRDEVHVPEQDSTNKPFIYETENRFECEFILHEALKSDFIPRADYGDLGDCRIFSRSMHESFDRFFGIEDLGFPQSMRKKLETKGIDLTPRLTNRLIVDAEFENFDDIRTEVSEKGRDTDFEVSANDVEKTFTLLCSKLLREQSSDETRVTNIARSWSPFKSLLRSWLGKRLNTESDTYYRIFINDIRKGTNSVFRHAITRGLREYRPKLEEYRQKRHQESIKREAETFRIPRVCEFTEDFGRIETQRCLWNDFYLRKEYPGRENELAFVRFLDECEKVEWWHKNADSGKEAFAVRYEIQEKDHLFYPDWIVKFRDGRIGIFDTKKGITASSYETELKAAALQKRLAEVNTEIGEPLFFGGIIIPENGLWYLNQTAKYEFIAGKLSSDWIPLPDGFVCE